MVRLLVNSGDIDRVNAAIDSGKYPDNTALLASVLATWIVENGTPVQFERARKRDVNLHQRFAAGHDAVYSRARREISALIAAVFASPSRNSGAMLRTEFSSKYDVPELLNEKASFEALVTHVVPSIVERRDPQSSALIEAVIAVLATPGAWADQTLAEWAVGSSVKILESATSRTWTDPLIAKLVASVVGAMPPGHRMSPRVCAPVLRALGQVPQAVGPAVASTDVGLAIARLREVARAGVFSWLSPCRPAVAADVLSSAAACGSCGGSALAAQAILFALGYQVTEAPAPVASSVLALKRLAIDLLPVANQAFRQHVTNRVAEWVRGLSAPEDVVSASVALASAAGLLSGVIPAILRETQDRVTGVLGRAVAKGLVVSGGYSCHIGSTPRSVEVCNRYKRTFSGMRCTQCSVRYCKKHSGFFGPCVQYGFDTWTGSRCGGSEVVACTRTEPDYDSTCVSYGKRTVFDRAAVEATKITIRLANPASVKITVNLVWNSRSSPPSSLLPPATVELGPEEKKSLTVSVANTRSEEKCGDLSRIRVGSVHLRYE